MRRAPIRHRNSSMRPDRSSEIDGNTSANPYDTAGQNPNDVARPNSYIEMSLVPPELVRSTNVHRRLPPQNVSNNSSFFDEYVPMANAGATLYPSRPVDDCSTTIIHPSSDEGHDSDPLVVPSIPSIPPSSVRPVPSVAIPVQAGIPIHQLSNSEIEEQQQQQLDLYQSRRSQEVTRSPFPLEGAMIYILQNSDKRNQEDCLATCLALGAKQTPVIDEATHAIWCGSKNRSTANLQELDLCECYSIPIVDVATWLQHISGLYSSQHWSEIDVSNHHPKWEETPSHASAGPKFPGDASTAQSSTNEFYAQEAQQSQFSNQEEKLRRSIERYSGITLDQPTDKSILSQVRRKDSLVDDSISQFLQEAQQEQENASPDSQEEKDLRLAMELSLLDVALVVKPQLNRKSSNPLSNEPPYVVLGISDDATAEEIRMAYKKRARDTHPDKGGQPGEFEAVARAYRAMLQKLQQNQGQQRAQDDLTQSSHFEDDGLVSTKQNVHHLVKNTAHWDMEIQDHWNMVQSLFQTNDGNIQDNLEKQKRSLAKLGLEKKEAGASNHDENKRIIRNSCFYLSLATSYLHGLGAYIATDRNDIAAIAADNALTGDTALQLKRIIEAAVLEAHPEWAQNGMVGEEVQAFSDFIVYSLDSPTSILADWAVAIFDTVSGYVDIYKGKNYNESEDEGGKYACSQNTITIRYASGDHYQPLLPSNGKTRPSLAGIMSVLDDAEVYYVVTDGSV